MWQGIYTGLLTELGHAPSQFERTLLRQATTLGVQIEEMVACQASGGKVDGRELRALIAEQRRAREDLGIKTAERKESAAASLRAYVGGGTAA